MKRAAIQFEPYLLQLLVGGCTQDPKAFRRESKDAAIHELYEDHLPFRLCSDRTRFIINGHGIYCRYRGFLVPTRRVGTRNEQGCPAIFTCL